MGAGLIVLAVLAVPPPAQLPDSNTFSSPAARALIARAALRHHAQDTSVTDYHATLRYRLSASLGRRRWGNAAPIAVEEQEATVTWQLPNDLRVDILGQRSRTREPGGNVFSAFDSPWFVPRGLSDSVRVFGTDFPDRAALHPLASDGPDWYRYFMSDTVVIGTPEGRRIRLIKFDVTPKRAGPALVAGKIWLDLESAEVVRFAFRYVGTDLWQSPEGDTRKDSADARRTNRLVNRFLSIEADLEYALQEGKYWMPYRQVLSGQVQVPLIGDVFIPFEAVTTFQDYEINSGRGVVFRLPRPDSVRRRTRAEREAYRDSLRAERRGRGRNVDSTQARETAGLLPGGGRFEIRRAPRDSLRRYAGWSDSLRLSATEEDERRLKETRRELADMVEGLSRDITGRRVTGFGYERLADAFRFNRVQGTSVGLGYQLDLKGLAYTSLYGTARFGLADTRPTVRVSLVRDAPSGKFTISAYHDLAEGDPFSRGLSASNAIRALVSARDEADYYRATGGSLAVERSLGTGVELTLAGRFERQRSAPARGKAWLNDVLGGDGLLGPNPPIIEGDFGGLLARVDGQWGRARWQLSADGLVRSDGDYGTARVYGSWRQSVGGGAGMTFRARGGIAGSTGSSALPQMGFRAGGQGSVRGFDYGIQRGAAFWSLSIDASPWRRAVRPVVFVDAGQAGPLDVLGRRPVLVGGGTGVSFLNGLVRFDLSHPITPQPSNAGLRFDIVLGAPR